MELNHGNIITRERSRSNIISRIDELATISEDDTGITRRYATPAAVEAGKKVLEWMRNAGLETKTDAIGNLRGRWPPKTPMRKPW